MKKLFVAMVLVASAAMAQTRNNATFAEQKMCADAAKAFFKEMGYPLAGFDKHYRNATYQAHYNKKLNKCFIKILVTPRSEENVERFFYDVFEGTQPLARWSETPFTGKGFGFIYTGSGIYSDLKARAEYEFFVEPFMTE